MPYYRAYYMKEDHIVAPESIEPADDAQAMLKAGEMLSISQFGRIEVWQETRVVGAVSTPSLSDEAKLKDAPHSSEKGESNIVEFRNR